MGHWGPRGHRCCELIGLPDWVRGSKPFKPSRLQALKSFKPSGSQLFDSDACLTPSREFWFAKGWHNRIRHVDPPYPIFSHIRSSRSKPEPMVRVPACSNARILQCDAVNACEKIECQIA